MNHKRYWKYALIGIAVGFGLFAFITWLIARWEQARGFFEPWF